MSIWLAGVPGLINTLLTRLTSTRAANLDNLDAAVTTRAPSSTALSTANWPGTRDNLVDLIAQVSGATPKTLYAGNAYGDIIDVYSKFDNTDANGMHGLGIVDSTTGTGASSGADWEDMLNISSEAGSVKLLCFGVTSSAAAGNWEAKITIDGSVVLNSAWAVGPFDPGVDSKTGRSIIGTLIFDTASPYKLVGIAFDDVRFKTSFRAEVKRGNVNTNIRMINDYHLNN